MLPFSFLIVRLYSLNLGSGCSACFFPLSFFSSRLFLILRVLLPFISKQYIEKQKVSSQSGRCGIYTSCFITMTITSSTSQTHQLLPTPLVLSSVINSTITRLLPLQQIIASVRKICKHKKILQSKLHGHLPC